MFNFRITMARAAVVGARVGTGTAPATARSSLWVNLAVIWNTSDQRTKADHFLVVTGIDTNKEIVHLNDPAPPTLTSRSPSPLS